MIYPPTLLQVHKQQTVNVNAGNSKFLVLLEIITLSYAYAANIIKTGAILRGMAQWVDSSACQKMACHFLRCHFGDLEKFLVPKLWQGILATKMACHF